LSERIDRGLRDPHDGLNSDHIPSDYPGASMTRPSVLLIASLVFAAGCQVAEQVPEYDGRNLYLGYCASCHGPTGAGDGPVAPSLVFTMQDLRTLSQRHDGFPREWLQDVIDGRTLRAVHGSRDMPVWGWQFRRVEPSEAYVAARIEALVDYLESIQIGDSTASSRPQHR